MIQKYGNKSFIFLFILVLTSCLGKSSVILDDSSCQTPCWRNISMGMKKDDVIALIKGMADISQTSIGHEIDNRRFYNEAISWNYTNRREEWVDIFFRDEKVIMTEFRVNNTIPLSAFIKKYGEPKQILIIKGRLESITLSAKFIYPEKGICLIHDPVLYFQDPQTYQIKPSTGIKFIYYIDPIISEGQTKIGCLENLDETEKKEYVQDWKGYGEYTVYEYGVKP